MGTLTGPGRSAMARSRFQGAAMPANLYFALAKVNKGVFVAGATYAVGDYVIPSVWANRIYKCTSAGAAGGEPTWPTNAGGAVTTGGATFVEQSTALASGTFAEADFTGYTRASMAANNTNFSEDGAGNVANLQPMTFGASNSGASAQLTAVVLEMSAASGGTVLSVEPMTNPQYANVGGGPVTTAAGSFTFQQT